MVVGNAASDRWAMPQSADKQAIQYIFSVCSICEPVVLWKGRKSWYKKWLLPEPAWQQHSGRKIGCNSNGLAASWSDNHTFVLCRVPGLSISLDACLVITLLGLLFDCHIIRFYLTIWWTQVERQHSQLHERTFQQLTVLLLVLLSVLPGCSFLSWWQPDERSSRAE